MLFSHLSAMAVATAFIWTKFPQVTATNQALMDCELKCSQRWSFPALASPSSTSSYIKAKPTSTYTPTETRVTDHAPTPITTSKVADSFQVEPSSSSKKHVAAVTSSPSSPNSPSTTSIRTVPISATTLKTTPTSNPDNNPKSSSSSLSIDGYLTPHNAARAAHGASPLSWSDELAAAAQRWANNCVFEHSGGSLGPYGENLAAGSGDYSAESGVAAWVNEAAQYNSANPVPSHFTQVVWKGTTQVGCAVASCNLANFDPQFWPVKFHVCEYSSPGNVIGQFAANVQA